LSLIGYELIDLKAEIKLFNGSLHKYGQKSMVKKIRSKINAENLEKYLLNKSLLSRTIKVKNTTTINGTIIPKTLTSIAKEHVKAKRKALLYVGAFKNVIA
tara:strand:+ start:362 stop:664 length:303 start_codon:yes stop_codon:yes gene_type:complete